VAQPEGHVLFEPTKLSHTLLLAHKADTQQSKQSNLGRKNASRHEHKFLVSRNYIIWALLLSGVFIASMMHTRAVAFVIGLELHTGGDMVVPVLKRTYAMSSEDVALRTEISVLTEPLQARGMSCSSLSLR
jgi:hypothetical protein